MEQNLLPKNIKGMRKLTDELRKLSSSINMDFLDENDDTLSLMVDETLKGVDIRKEYPLFYHTLTKNADLRQRFIDAITLDVSDLPIDLKINRQITQLQTALAGLSESQTKKWQLSIPDLSAIFFPKFREAYRGLEETLESGTTLFNNDIELQPVVYSLWMEAKRSQKDPTKVLVKLDFSLTSNSEEDFAALPVELEITWGDYFQHLTLNDEGVVNLTDVPLVVFLNADFTQVTAAMDITLSRPQ